MSYGVRQSLRLFSCLIFVPLFGLIYVRALASLLLPWLEVEWLEMFSYLPPHFILILAMISLVPLAILKVRRLAMSLVLAALLAYTLDGDHSLSRLIQPNKALALDQQERTAKFSIMALNAQCYTKGFRQVHQFIQEQKPDLVFMSENCSHRHPATMSSDYIWPSPEASTTILSRLPMIAYHDIDLPSPRISLTRHNQVERLDELPPRQFAHATVLVQDQPVHAISLRFIAGRAPSHSPLDKIAWGRRLFRYQKQELHFVLQYISQLEGPVVLGGDLNAPPGSLPIKRLTQRLRDASLSHHLFGGFTFRNDVLATMRLDFLLYSDGIESLQSRILPVKISDHYPLLGEFKRL